MTASRKIEPHPALVSLVSFFDSAFAQEPTEQAPLQEILERIKSGAWGQEVAKLRKMVEANNEKGYNDAKRRLPAFAMSGAFLTRDAQVPLAAKMISHSGVLQCDFDRKDNPHMDKPEDLVALLRTDPHVLFGFISPSGVGIKAGVVIDGEHHAESFLTAESYFLKKYSLQIDRSTKDPIRLCFVSADAGAWWNEAAQLLPVDQSLIASLSRPTKASPSSSSSSDTWFPPAESTAEDVREMLKFVPSRPEYADWIRIASAVWSVLPMEEGCRLLAEWSPEESPGEYTAKHRARLTQIGIGTLVHYAQAGGFDARAAARRRQWAGRIRFADNATPATVADVAHDPAAEVHYIELTREFLAKCLESQQVGDARLWASMVRGKKLYDHLALVWRTYDRGIWSKDDLRQTIIEATDATAGAYSQLAESVREEMRKNPAPEGKRDAREKVIAAITDRQRKLANHGYITAVLKFAESLLATKATQFDQAPHLICLENGVIDFESGLFREHRPTDMLTFRANILFDAEAQCPRWLAFLNFAMGNDREMIAYLARAVGYSLTGFVDKDVLFFCYGKGANGKSTYTSALKMLGGEMMTTISIEALLARQSDNNFDYKKAMLEGKHIVITDEIPENRKLNDAAIKALVGGDEITARRPYEKPYTFSPTHKLWLVGNHKPEVQGTDYGIWRRIHLIPWANTIPEDKRRPRHEVLAELRAELPGILNWAIRGYIDMQDNGGLRPPALVQDFTKEYMKDSDRFGAFLDERTVKDAAATTPSKELLHAYLAWCQDNGETARVSTSKKVTTYMKEKGFEVGEDRQRFSIIRGLRLVKSE